MNVQIYTLSHPETGYVFYVGKTKMKLSDRLHCHWTQFNDIGKKMSAYMLELKIAGKKPILEIIEAVKQEDGKTFEEYWTQQFSSWGFSLCNHRFNTNKSFYQRKTEKSFIRKAITDREFLLIKELYNSNDLTLISTKLKCSDEHIRKIIQDLLKTNNKKLPEWVRLSIVNLYLEKAERISKIYNSN